MLAEDTAQHYDKFLPFYLERHGEIVQSFYPKKMEEFLLNIGETLELDKGSCILDLGSGFGGVAQFMHKTFGSNVVGLEISKYAFSHAKRYENPSLQFLNMDFNRLKKIPGKYDAILMFETIGYVDYLSDFAKQCYQKLTFEGKVFIKSYAPRDEKKPIFNRGNRDMTGYKIEPFQKIVDAFLDQGFIMTAYEELDYKDAEERNENFYHLAGVENKDLIEFVQIPVPYWAIFEK